MDPAPWLKGDQFDGVMNYRWAVAMCDFFINHTKKITASQFVQRLQDLNKSYPPQTRYQLLNLLDSHDTDRIASHIVNPDLFYDKMVTLNDNPAYNVRRPHEDEWQILRLMAMVQITFPGPPMIYYGTEAGMWGADDPDERKPMVWPGLTYRTETANISQTPRPADPVVFDQSLFNYYSKIIHIRNSQPALQNGDFKINYTNDIADQLVYSRTWGDEKITIAVNNALQAGTVTIKVQGRLFRDLMTGAQVSADAGQLKLQMPAKSMLVLKRVVM